MPRFDRHSEPIRTMVALGESTVAGMCASSEERRWVSVVARLISESQGTPVTLHNRGISANAISPRSPGYATSAKPSALERYHTDVIVYQPDLFILAYGLNDMRAGMALEDFRQDMAQIITDVTEACHPVTVLTSVYYMTAYDLYPPYDKGSIAITEGYNQVIRELAEEHNCLFADIWAAEGQADWVVHPDTVHANDLGHLLIAHRVFQEIAVNCSGVATGVTTALAGARAEVAATMAQRRAPQKYG